MSAQTPIVIGPTTVLAWDQDAASPAVAQGFTYKLSMDGGSPLTLAGVTCVAGTVATTQTCSVLAQAILPLGSHTLTMTASNASGSSLPSTPLTYLVVVIPAPQNLRFQ